MEAPMQHDLSLTVNGMTCGGCENAVRRALGTLPGVSDVTASHAENHVALKYDPALVSPQAVRERIQKLGYHVA
jgi:copper chaperone CopZ